VNEAAIDPVVAENLRQLTLPGEPDVLTQVLHLFLQEAPKRIQRLEEAWQSGDHAEVHRAAHSLKGSAGNIGAGPMFAVCRDLDEQAQAGDLTNAADLVAALAREYARVEAEIQRLLT
jgi:HPt (histidine-containing phosphotransfer) domain-containing protein